MSLKNDIRYTAPHDLITADNTLRLRNDVAVIPIAVLLAWLEWKIEDRAWNIFDEGQRSAYQHLLSELEVNDEPKE